MVITKNKILSLPVSLMCIAYSYFKLKEILTVCVLLIIPLILIWFPEGLGNFQGYVGRGRHINQKTHPIILEVIGWIFLIGILVLIYRKK